MSSDAADLVLMDIEMPLMGGLQAAAAIRGQERKSGGHLPIIAMTARTRESDHQHFRLASMDDVLTKPLRREVLSASLAHWITLRSP